MAQRKLLLADDSITIQKVVNLTFADEGIEVITASDGDTAMEKVSEVVPDLVMADVNMPGLNGYQLCERIKQSETLAGTPVILLVGSFEPFDEDEARRVGADDFLTKPFQSIRQLVNKVTELLQNAPQNGGRSSIPEATASFENAETISNFDNVQDYIPSDSNSEQPEQAARQFDDGGLDDEMIQTSNAGSFALDESSKFETREIDETEDIAKTQPLSADDLKQFSFSNQSGSFSNETADVETFGEGTRAVEDAPQNEDAAEELVMSRSASVLDANEDDDLLEIPFDEDEEEWEEEEEQEAPAEVTSETETQFETQTETAESAAAFSETSEAARDSIETIESGSDEEGERGASFETTDQNETSAIYAQSESPASLAQTPTTTGSDFQLSPEMIDAIAQRVVEKMSDKAVKEVAWEVVPQLADLIIRKMAEEKLKQ